MSQTLLEKHQPVVIEIAKTYLENMELELARKYKDNNYEIHPTLSDEQYTELKSRYEVSNNEFADLYSEFQKMKPTSHLNKVMSAFTASGGSVEIEPVHDEGAQRLKVAVNFFIGDKSFEIIEGLSPIEDLLLRMDAMRQVDTILSGSDPDVSPAF